MQWPSTRACTIRNWDSCVFQASYLLFTQHESRCIWQCNTLPSHQVHDALNMVCFVLDSLYAYHASIRCVDIIYQRFKRTRRQINSLSNFSSAVPQNRPYSIRVIEMPRARPKKNSSISASLQQEHRT
ncbi:hypothetical protein BDR07DRAFT_220320 [Suillus spraguei]|nr:hypothetical protein BDR07DRAFT_220320 [Suillus spraguei]